MTTCYCERSESAILRDLLRGRIPEEGLVNTCCWRRVCRVRANNELDPEVWIRICTERGYLLQRQNPRGF